MQMRRRPVLRRIGLDEIEGVLLGRRGHGDRRLLVHIAIVGAFLLTGTSEAAVPERFDRELDQCHDQRRLATVTKGLSTRRI